MFKELLPILRHRAVLMTVTFIEEDQIRVNVVPKKLKDDENNALTTPVTLTGSAEELDAELGSTLVNFVGAHLQLKNTLESAKADMEAAAKAAQAEARSKSKTPAKKEAAQPKPKDEAKPAEPANPPVPKTVSLFDMPAPEPPATPAPVPTAAMSDTADEDEVVDEIRSNENNEDDDAGEELDEAA